MSTSAVSSYEDFIKALQHLMQPTTSPADVKRCNTCLQTSSFLLYTSERVPRAVWKKLIHKVKVPEEVAKLCVQAQQQNPRSAAAFFAGTRLSEFIQAAETEAKAAPSTQLGAAIWQQVQRAGLLQQLAAMMTAAAEELSAQTAAGVFPGLAAVDRSSSSSSSNAILSPLHLYPHKIHEHSYAMLNLCLYMLQGLPSSAVQLSDGTIAGITAAAAQLLMGSLRHISAAREQLQQQRKPVDLHWVKHATWLIRAGYLTVLCVLRQCKKAGGLKLLLLQQQQQQQQPLLLAAELLPCLTSAIAFTALHATRVHSNSTATNSKLSAVRSASSSSGALGGSSEADWLPPERVAVELPPSILQLFDALGVSGQAMLWAADCLSRASPDAQVADPVKELLEAYEDCVSLCSSRLGDLSSDLRRLLCRACFLLPGVLLRWAVSVPAAHPDAAIMPLVVPLACANSCEAGLRACRAAECSIPQDDLADRELTPAAAQQADGQQKQQQQQQQQRVQLGRPLSGAQTSGQLGPSREALIDMLPWIMQLCTTWLQQQQQQQQQDKQQQQQGPGACLSAAAKTPSNSAPSSSSSSSGSGPQTNATASWQHQTALRLLGCALVCLMSSVAVRGLQPSQPFVLTSADIFLQYGPRFVSIPETVVRRTAGPGTVTDAQLERMSAAARLWFPMQRVGDGDSALLLLGRAAGLGSEMQHHVYSLLCSMLKVSGLAALDSPLQQEYAGSIRKLVAETTLSLMLGPYPDAAATTVTAAGTAAAAAAAAGGTSSTATLAGVAPTSSASTAAIAALPGLTVIGRCLLLWGGHWQQQQQQEPGHNADSSSSGMRSLALVRDWSLRVLCWLQTSSVSAQLSAAGYNPQAVVQELQQLAAVLAVVAPDNSNDSSGDTSAGSSSSSGGGGGGPVPGTEADYAAVVQQLRSAGLALCAFAVPCLCNNPDCVNMSGPTELSLVSGRSCLCGGCRVARYCSKPCQKAHWKQHKPVCAALAAAAACAGSCTEQ